MFGSLGSPSAIHKSLLGPYILWVAMFPRPCLFGGMKEPSLYIHCCRLYLGVFMRYNVSGRGVVLLWKVDGVVLGVARDSFVNFDYVVYECGLCGVGFHMCVVKFQDVGCEVLN